MLGHLPFAALLKMMGPAMKRMPLPPDRREVLVAEFRKNDPHIVRRGVRYYFRYLDRYGSVASRLCGAGVPAWVVHGERGDGGVTDDERRTLEACPRIRVITLPGASYFTPNEEPALVAKLVVEALDRVRSDQEEQRSVHREGGTRLVMGAMVSKPASWEGARTNLDQRSGSQAEQRDHLRRASLERFLPSFLRWTTRFCARRGTYRVIYRIDERLAW